MPTYEYECMECKKRVEFYQGMNEAPKTDCPGCGAVAGLRRLISAGGGIIFKGSGFYQTDYRSQEYKDRLKKETDGSGGDAGNNGSKTEKPGDRKKESETGKSGKTEKSGFSAEKNVETASSASQAE